MWFSCCERHRRLIPAASNLFRPLRVLGVLVILLSLTASPLFAKRKDDLVVLKNGDHITGEIKIIEHGTIYF
jgi:hypothetical protein